MKIAIFTANYKNPSRVEGFVKHLSELSEKKYDVNLTIIDNSGDLENIKEEWVDIIKPTENLYYLNGCCYGVELYLKSLGELSPPDFIFICNYDIVFKSDFFDNLSKIKPHADEAVIAPRIISKDLIEQNPYFHRRPGYLELKIRTLLMSNFYGYFCVKILSWAKRTLLKRFISRTLKLWKEAEEIYACHGSVFIFRPKLIGDLNVFSSQLKMYHEEMLVAETIRRLGLKIYYRPSLVVRHEENASINLVSNSLASQWTYESSSRIMEIYHGKFK